MRFRFVGLIDVGALIVALIAVLLPAREMFAMDAHKGTSEARFAVALAEARSVAHPDDPVAATALSHQLSKAGFRDWAVESAVRGSARSQGQPERWRILFATAEAFLDQYAVEKGLGYADQALAACGDGTNPTCPDWERARLVEYDQQLDASVKSGIDPHKDPVGFRVAGERALHGVHITGHEAELQPGSPAPAGSAAGSSAP